jgi:mono/diheme cytochrome c family protein
VRGASDTIREAGETPTLRLFTSLITAHAAQPLFRDAVLSSLTDLEPVLLARLWSDPAWQTSAPGKPEFLEALASAIVRAGHTDDITHLLVLLDADPAAFDWRQEALLAGIAIHAGRRDFQPVRLAAAPAIVAQAERFTDRAVRSRIDKLPRLFDWPGHRASQAARPLTAKQQELFAQGRQLYLVTCAGCHGPDGAGLEPQGPPLLDSEWVLGPEDRLIRILLHGMEGPVSVNGTRYEPPRILTEMPSLAVLDNESLAAVLTYIRREWDHAADPVDPKTVSRLRTNTQGRTRPWTEGELLGVGSHR